MDEAVEAKEEATEAKGDAQVAKDMAQQAKDEADKAVESTSNLSTMFYIAFGISLVALLMGFVGPIRISRKPMA
jgi:hypothetical protein